MKPFGLIAIGFALGVLTSWVSLPRTGAPVLQRQWQHLPAPAAAPKNSSTIPARCDLGVVVARQEVEVAADIGGLIEGIYVEVGDPVEAGELLARLDARIQSQDLAAERSALSAARAEVRHRQVAVRRAEADRARRELLADLVSREDLAGAVAEVEQAQELVTIAEAEVQRIEARVERLETVAGQAEIRAPFSGRVAARHLDSGAHAVAGTPILRLLGDENLRVRFAASLKKAWSLHIGASVIVEVPDRGLRLPATIEQMAPEIDSASDLRFSEVRLDLSGDQRRLRAGEMVWVAPAGGAPCPARHGGGSS